MSLSFLIPLIMALVTGYLSQQLSDDDAELLGLVAIANLLLSLVLAPWQLQLLLLMLLIRRLERG